MQNDLTIEPLLERLETLEAKVAALRQQNRQRHLANEMLRLDNERLHHDHEQFRQDHEQLRGENQQLRQENERLRRDNQHLHDQIARLKKNSSNSSKPPSSDIVKPPKNPPRRGRKRKIGGQPGHPRHQRPPFDANPIDKICLHELPPQEVRRRRLRPLQEWRVLQQVELIDKPYAVTEHRARCYVTPSGRMV
jgi:regulator of replication initiation timing